MRFGDPPPPMSSDSVNSIADSREIAEEFSRQMSQPLLPKWNDVSDEPCLCVDADHNPDVISIWEVPYGSELHLIQCEQCGKLWKVKVAE